MAARLEQWITPQNVLRVTQLLMDMDTAVIEERYQKMGVRQLLKEQIKTYLQKKTDKSSETIPFFPFMEKPQDREALRIFALQLANLFTSEAKEQLTQYLSQCDVHEHERNTNH